MSEISEKKIERMWRFDFFAQPAEAEVRPGRFFRADRQAKGKPKQEH
jgi:hypothetical protein